MTKGATLNRLASCHADRKHFSRGMCGGCYKKWWNKANPEKHRDQKRRAWHRWFEKTGMRNYPKALVSGKVIAKMAEAQGRRCAVCQELLKRPNVDHDHKTGQVRGLLCMGCNLGLGNFKDSVEVLQRAIDYLTKTGTWQ